ncbi:Kinesin motor domain, partial [Trinorchestia longiramus]
GSQHRATGATAMNAHSSRSHALFCISIQQWRKDDSNNVVCAKFTLVDLAGSERAKKTGATGQRFKEGCHINSGLLSLGKVISSLVSGKDKHIPYRESKLTRLLQDSLGGNSHTLMLACISPADNSLEETLSTLGYADRARQIKNKPIVNCDPKAAEIAKLKQQVHELQLQLITASSGRDIHHSSEEVAALKEENRLLKEENLQMVRALQDAFATNTNMAIKDVMVTTAYEKMHERLGALQTQMDNTVHEINQTCCGGDPVPSHVLADNMQLLKQLQQQVTDLQAAHKENEEQLVSHELTHHQSTTADDSSTADDNSTADEDEVEENLSNDGVITPPKHNGTSEEGNHTTVPGPDCTVAIALKRSQKGQELANLNHALAQKEELMRQMLNNDKDISMIRSSYERAIQELQERIATVEHEKESLQQQIVSAPSNPASKLAEQRRKRVQELTQEIADLKHKMIERNKALKMKEMSEKRVELLSNEIKAMKQARVKLIRQMKEDNDRFKKAQQLKNKEIEKLKMQERKKDFKMVKMERMNKMQQNVLRRKIEEASALNKRLKEALDVQKACSDKRASSNLANRQQRLKNWLEGELELVAVKQQAKQSLESLREDRKYIGNQQSKVRQQLQHEDLSVEFKEELQAKDKQLNTDLQLRTAQINELQQKILEGDGDAVLERKRFDSLQGMSETKTALTLLFNKAVQHKAMWANCNQELQELQAQHKELLVSAEETEAMLEDAKAAHKKQILKLEKEHENKILCLLKDAMPAEEQKEENSDQKKKRSKKSVEKTQPSPDVSALQRRLKSQEIQLSRLSSVQQQLTVKTEECEALKQQTTDLTSTLNASMLPPLLGLSKPNITTTRRVRKLPEQDDDYELSSGEDDDDEEDETCIDPAWRRTPLCVRIKAMKRRARPKELSLSDCNKENVPEDEDSQYSVTNRKRESEGTHCGCMTDCSSKRCKCKRLDASCSSSCRCSALKCANKSSLMIPNASLQQDRINSTFEISPNASKRLKLSTDEGISHPLEV